MHASDRRTARRTDSFLLTRAPCIQCSAVKIRTKAQLLATATCESTTDDFRLNRPKSKRWYYTGHSFGDRFTHVMLCHMTAVLLCHSHSCVCVDATCWEWTSGSRPLLLPRRNYAAWWCAVCVSVCMWLCGSNCTASWVRYQWTHLTLYEKKASSRLCFKPYD